MPLTPDFAGERFTVVRAGVRDAAPARADHDRTRRHRVRARLDPRGVRHHDRSLPRVHVTPRPETILVVTGGAPDDEKPMMRVILRAAKRVHKQDELAVSFIQVGGDPGARRFLKILDDELVRAGAPHDICSTVTLDEAEGLGLTEVLLATFAA